MFTLENGKVSYVGSPDSCPAVSEVSLEFKLTSKLIGEATETITVPVKTKEAVKAFDATKFEAAKTIEDVKDRNFSGKEDAQEKEVEKLSIQEMRITPTGKLSIIFSKPIYDPNFRQAIVSEVPSNSTRLLQSEKEERDI